MSTNSFCLKLFSPLLLCSLISMPAMASGGTIVATVAMQRQQRDREERQSEIPLPPQRNDAFVEVSEFYKEGPEFRICPERLEEKRIVAYRKGCAIKTRVNDGFFSVRGVHYEYQPISSGLSPQDYLDTVYGKSTVEFVGVSNRVLRNRSQLVLFYRLTEKQASK